MNGLSITTFCGQWSQHDYNQPLAVNMNCGFMMSTGRGVFRNFLWRWGTNKKFKVYIVITFPSQKTVVIHNQIIKIQVFDRNIIFYFTNL
jgi:hypothetical protein